MPIDVDLDNLGILIPTALHAKWYKVFLVKALAGVTTAALERDAGYSGAGLVLTVELRDDGGRAAFDLAPRRGEIEARLGPGEEAVELSTFVVGFPEEGNANAKAAAGPTLRIRRTRPAGLAAAPGTPPEPTHAVVFRLVHHATERPIANAEVSIRYPDATLHRHVADAQGFVRLQDVPAGEYRLEDVRLRGIVGAYAPAVKEGD